MITALFFLVPFTATVGIALVSWLEVGGTEGRPQVLGRPPRASTSRRGRDPSA